METLNLKAFQGDLDITKLSYHAFATLLKIMIARCRSALGFGVGPMLITKDPKLAKLLQQN